MLNGLLRLHECHSGDVALLAADNEIINKVADHFRIAAASALSLYLLREPVNMMKWHDLLLFYSHNYLFFDRS